ncbi:MAG: diphthamide synthesis protein [Candidatus Woesearchaeota archaeon]
MDVFHIPVTAEAKATLDEKVISALPERLCLAASAQFVSQLPEIKKLLEAKGKKASLVEAKHTAFPGQILGCGWENLKYDEKAEAFLYIGDGMFHPKALMMAAEKDVFALDPINGSFAKLDRKEIEAVRKKTKVAIVKFLHAQNIGVLLSTKPGQMMLKEALELKKKFPDKKFYYLVSNTVEFNQLENFPFVDCFVNTACNRLIDDWEKFPKPVLNIADLPA